MDYKQAFQMEREALFKQYLVSSAGIPIKKNLHAEKFLRELSRLTDRQLQKIWKQFHFPSDCALLAVGGYGRGELFPYSDIDIALILPEHSSHAVKDKCEKWVHFLWDLGLDIGHSIRTQHECLSACKADITINTSLLEARLLAGSRKCFQELKQKHLAQLDVQHYYQDKILELRQRHIKFEDTPYSLEPNCKESPGGLRDLQVILWVSKGAQLGSSWRELAQNGLITEEEAAQLKRTERAFKDMRIRLHLQAGRREDRLIFDLQTAVAKSLGLHATTTRRASELLMQRYYWAAKTVTQLNTILLQNLEAKLFPLKHSTQAIDAHFNELNGFVDVVHPWLFHSQPEMIFESFLILAKRPELKGLSVNTLRAIWHNKHVMNQDFRRNIFNRANFLKIIQSERGVTHALRAMNQMGLLGRYLPNFRRIVGQMQHDLFHAYTVDQHILMVVRNLRRFALSEHAHEYPFCSELMANFEEPWVITIAALFHDIAKGRRGDHSELGVADAKQFCHNHGISQANTQLICFLVQHHLTMSHTAQKQDIYDPDVITQFISLVKDERCLTALYLLTVADIRGTSPKVWNAWKAKLLENLYKTSLNAIKGDQPSAHKEHTHRQQQARAQLENANLDLNEIDHLWQNVDISYFLRNTTEDIVWQTQKIVAHTQSQQSHRPLVACKAHHLIEPLHVVMVYVKDQNDLFSRICHYFSSHNFNIYDAKIHTTQTGYALDTFVIELPKAYRNQANLIQELENQIEKELGRSLSTQQTLSELSKGRLSRLSRSFPLSPTVELLPDDKGQHYLLSITANDRNGLLYSIANILAKHHIHIHMAKIMTLGERVEDVFLIEGNSLHNPKVQIEVESEILDALRL